MPSAIAVDERLVREVAAYLRQQGAAAIDLEALVVPLVDAIAASAHEIAAGLRRRDRIIADLDHGPPDAA